MYVYTLWKARQSKNELFRMGAAGSLTMFICDFSCYSIESINARQKIVKGENVGFIDMTQRVLKNEGIAAMYKGYSASFYSIITHGFLYFYVYKGLKVFLKDHFKPETAMGKALIYGAASTLSLCVDTLCYPMEMIRIRLLTMNDKYKYRSVSDAILKINKSESWRGLYRGGTSYFANLVGVYSVNLTLYELFIDAATKHAGSLEAFKKHETRHVIEASVYCSIITVLLMNFLEVIVVRRQSGCIMSVKDMFREEGLKMLTKGISAKLLHSVFGCTLFYLTMNKIEKIYNVELSDDKE